MPNQSQQLYQALLKAFPTKFQLAEMVRWAFDENLDVIAEGENHSERVFNLITQWAEAHNKVRALILAAHTARPGDARLLELAQNAGLSLKAPPDLEKLIRPALGIAGFQRLSRLQFQVCQVRWNGRPQGTGFLVGPDLVMTNHHVAFATAAAAPLSGLSVIFDYKRRPGKDAVDQGWPVELADDFLVAASPQEQLDYALLRLKDPAGEQFTVDLPNGIARGWLSGGVTVKDGDPLVVVQHPMGDPLSIAFGNVKSHSDNRLQHDANTEPGSSGSPCLSAALELAALHHASINGPVNQAIPWPLILTDLAQKKINLPPPPQ